MNRPLLALAIAGIAFSGCVFDGEKSVDPSGSATIFALGTKYTSDGGLAALDGVSGDSSLSKGLLNLTTSDAVLDRDAAGGVLYVLDRSKSTVTGYLASDLSQVALDVNVGSSANPYAVASLSGRLWVACYGSSFLKAVDISTRRLVDSIDLSAYADTKDGQTNPSTFAVHAWNGKIVVVLGRLNGWQPGDSSLVLVLDPASRSVEKRIALPWKNAYGADWSGDRLLVACTGAWKNADYTAIVLDGGLVLVDLAGGTARALVSEQTAGGNIGMVAFGPSGSAFVGIADASNATSVRTVDLSSGSLGASVSGAANATSFAWDGNSLWLGTKSSTLLRATSTGSVLDTLSTTLPPTSLAIFP